MSAFLNQPIERRALLTALGVLVAGCNIRPLYLPEGADLRSDLAAIDVRTPDTRVGWIFANALRDGLNPTARDVPTRYVLDVEISTATSDAAIRGADVTRFNYRLTADALLRSASSEDVLFRTQVVRLTSYNLVEQPFASLISEQDAERRAAEEVAIDLRTQVAAYLHRNGGTGAT